MMIFSTEINSVYPYIQTNGPRSLVFIRRIRNFFPYTTNFDLLLQIWCKLDSTY